MTRLSMGRFSFPSPTVGLFGGILLNPVNELEYSRAMPFALDELDGFPTDVYEANYGRYAELESWYDGTELDLTETRGGKEVEIYPVKINPLRGAVAKHAAVLFGDVVDDGRPLVVPRLIPYLNDKSSKDAALAAEEALNVLWYENNGRALQLRAGFLSQIFGGVAFKLSYVPWETWRTIPIRIELVHPKNFVGVADASDYWRLSRGYVVRQVTKDHAKQYGVTVDEDYAFQVEEWRRDRYKVIIDGKLASVKVGQDFHVGGANPFGVVPIAYIPHIRISGFYGDSLIDGLQGIVKEINLRYADFGDAVSEDAHAFLGMRNVNGTPRLIKLAEGLEVVDLRSAPQVTGGESEPDIFSLKKPSASQAMKMLVDVLYEQFRRDAFVPAVADGEDEGSQRSAMTLAFRMWPLASHVLQERINWTAGLDWLGKMALIMMAKKKLMGITDEHIKMRQKQDWAPMFPRDREALINELVLRASGNLGAIETLLELTGDIEDIEDEKKKILAWKKILVEAETPPENEISEEQDEHTKANKKKESEGDK
jgi:hypothetical protein